MKRFLLIVFFFSFTFSLLATHSRGGYITAERVSGTTISLRVVYFQDIRSTAYRDSLNLLISYNGNAIDTISIKKSKSIQLEPDNVKTIFQQQYTLPGPGHYTFSISDPNLVENIRNVLNSVNVPAFIKTEIFFDPDFSQTVKFDTIDTKPIQTNHDTLYYHLHPLIGNQKVLFELVTPESINDVEVPGYDFLNATVSSNSGLFNFPFDPKFGHGVFLFAVEASTLSQGQITSRVQRTILVYSDESNGFETELTPVDGFPKSNSRNDYELKIIPGTSDTLTVEWKDPPGNLDELIIFSPDLKTQEEELISNDTFKRSRFIIFLGKGQGRDNPYYVTIRGVATFNLPGTNHRLGYSEDISIVVDNDLQKVLGLPDNEDNGLTIFPNPVSDILRISGTGAKEKQYYQIYDLSGRMVQSGVLRNGTIKISALGSGIYLLKSVNGKRQWSQGRFVKE